jgi:transposase-like protein
VDSPPVVIVGAGPTGLAAACAPLAGGATVRVLVRAAAPAGTSGALGLQPRGSEVLERLGALDDLPQRSLPIHQLAVSVAGRELARLAVGRPTRLVRRPGLLVSQTEIESALRDRLATLGGRVEWGSVTLTDEGLGQGVSMRRRHVQVPPPGSSFAGFRFPREVIVLAVRWYLRYGLSYRDGEELLAERGIDVDHVTVFRWVQRFTPLLIDAARPCLPAPADRWFIDETYVKVAGRWVYLYRAIDQFGQVIDILVAQRRDRAVTRRFFTRALEHGPSPIEILTDSGDLPARSGRAGSGRLPPHRTLRQQPDRSRPQPTYTTPTPDARPETTPLRTSDQHWPRLRAQPPPQPLRTRDRAKSKPPGPGCLRRADPGDLTNRCQQPRLPQLHTTQLCRRPPIWSVS